MTAVTFDTLASVRRLKAHGIAQEQAEAIAEEMRAAHDSSRGELVTQIDLYTVKTELKEEIAALRTDMAEMKAELLKWYIGIAMFQTVAFLGGIIAIAKIFHP
ncbi:MAG: hypothetical protein KGI29_07420 [Pseudomonadota bacterium]|nr:hypothetical protein [Pseudomonadota bacterium]MDE3037728.1 hypothetical protein [Pseudomonadota bacterium]